MINGLPFTVRVLRFIGMLNTSLMLDTLKQLWIRNHPQYVEDDNEVEIHCLEFKTHAKHLNYILKLTTITCLKSDIKKAATLNAAAFDNKNSSLFIFLLHPGLPAFLLPQVLFRSFSTDCKCIVKTQEQLCCWARYPILSPSKALQLSTCR